MTIQIHDGPGTETYRSTRYSVAITGSASTPYVYGLTRTATVDTAVWDPADDVELSWLSYGADVTTTAVVTLLSGAITEAIVYPKAKGYTSSVSGGVLTITMPVGAKVFVVVNDDWVNTLCLFADALKPAIPGGYITYNGSQTKVTTGTCLYFPAGVHDIGQLFEIESNSTMYLEGGAWLTGNIDIRENVGCVIMGRGVISGEDFDKAAIRLLPFADAIEYSAILGFTLTGDNFSYADNSISGVTLTDHGFYGIHYGMNFADGVKVISAWHPNSDGVKTSIDISDSGRRHVDDCFIFASDDALSFPDNRGITTCDNNVIIGASSATLNFSYWGWENFGGSVEVTDTYTVRMSRTEAPSLTEYSHVIKAFNDQDDYPPDPGTIDVTIDGLYVEGEYCDQSSLFHLENKLYEWGKQAEAQGNIAYWSISNVTVEYEPIQNSSIKGRDGSNTPHDIAFENVVIDGVQLTRRNFNSYVDTNDGNFLYNITIDGITMVSVADICNTALTYLGDDGRVASISPTDGSAQSRLCARFYPMARDAVLELHPWSFSLRRVALTEVTADETTEWDYCYEIPADMLRAIAVQPEDSVGDYTVPGAAGPLPGYAAKVPVEFAIEQDADGVLRLFTDQEDAWLRYTAYVTDTGAFSPLFVQAVAWKLAAMLASPMLKGEAGAAEAKRCEQMMAYYLGKAGSSDSNQRKINPAHSPSWISNR